MTDWIDKLFAISGILILLVEYFEGGVHNGWLFLACAFIVLYLINFLIAFKRA